MSYQDHRRSMSAPASVLLLALLLASGAALASPAKVESIEGSDVKRVTLDPKAAERLDIQTTPVREEKIVFRTVVLGEVEDEPKTTDPATPAAAPDPANAPDPASTAATPAPKPAPSSDGKMRVLVLLDSDADDDRDDDAGDIDDEDSAEILALGDDDDDDEPLRAKRVVLASKDETDANTIYFKLPSSARHILTPGQRVGVRLAAPGSSVPRKVIPYSAVLYDAKGDAWVYTNPGPLQFVRQRVAIDVIDQGVAILEDGPAVGTNVVTVGAAELFGAESGVGH
jgi:hypothetical protein